MRSRHLGQSLGVLLAAIGFATLLGIAQAAGPLPGNPPYQQTGKIEYIDLSKSAVVINDREYSMPYNLRVHSGKNLVSPGYLSRGMTVGFTFDDNGHKATLTEVWILS
jgi:hypothetical protein